jgi:hypothetical protein
MSEHGEKEEERAREEERRRGSGVACRDSSRGSSRRFSGRKQEVASGRSRVPPRTCSQCPSEEDKSSLQKAPWLWGVFLGNAKQNPYFMI